MSSSSSSVQNAVTMPSDQTSILKVNSSRRTAINALVAVIFAAMIAGGIIAAYGAFHVGHKGLEALNFVGKVISENPIPFGAGFVTAVGAAVAYTLHTKKSESSTTPETTETSTSSTLPSTTTTTNSSILSSETPNAVENSSTTSSSDVTPVVTIQQAVQTPAIVAPAIVVPGLTIGATSSSVDSTTSTSTANSSIGNANTDTIMKIKQLPTGSLIAAVIATTAVGTTLSTAPIPTPVVHPEVPAMLSFLSSWRNTSRTSDGLRDFLAQGGKRTLADKEFAIGPARNPPGSLFYYVRFGDYYYRFQVSEEQRVGVEEQLDTSGFKIQKPPSAEQTPNSSTANPSPSVTTASQTTSPPMSEPIIPKFQFPPPVAFTWSQPLVK